MDDTIFLAPHRTLIHCARSTVKLFSARPLNDDILFFNVLFFTQVTAHEICDEYKNAVIKAITFYKSSHLYMRKCSLKKELPFESIINAVDYKQMARLKIQKHNRLSQLLFQEGSLQRITDDRNGD